MSMSFTDACNAVGYNRHEKCPLENPRYFYAYKNGEMKSFTDRKDAEKFSIILEIVYPNKPAVDAWWAVRAALEAKAQEVWHTNLKEYWAAQGVVGALFDACYSEAYDRGHSSGYDEVANYMYDVTSFAKKVIKCNV